MGKYKNIVFDVGDVLLSYRWKPMLMDYGLSEEEAERVGAEMFDCPERIWSDFDLGNKSDEEIIQDFERLYPDDGKIIRWFISHGEYMASPRPAVWERLHELKGAGYHLFLLSNYPETLFKKHTQYADFMDDIDGSLVSYMIHEAKPDRVIYAALCEKYSLDPAETIFFDDRAENVEGAIAFGMDAEQVRDQESFLERLGSFL